MLVTIGGCPKNQVISYLGIDLLMPMSISLLAFIDSVSLKLQNIGPIVSIEKKTHGGGDAPQ
jgi:hypothetical protein